MTLAALFDRVEAAAKGRLDQKSQKLAAVYDDQLWTILAELNLLIELDAGTLRCHLSGVPLTRENLAGLVGTPSGPRPVALSGLVGAEFATAR
jgi:hypothetical protein